MQADSLDIVSRLCLWEPSGTDSPASLSEYGAVVAQMLLDQRLAGEAEYKSV